MNDIFISWRRLDNPDTTGRIHEHVVKRFGEQTVFRDIEKIPLGDDFRKALQERLGDCKVLLAIVGPDWLKSARNDAKPSGEDTDWVQTEILTAKNLGIPVVPVYIAGASPADLDVLPGRLENFPNLQSYTVRPDPDFTGDVARLLDRLQQQFPSITRAKRGSTRLAFDQVTFSLWNWIGGVSESQIEHENPATRFIEAVIGTMTLALMLVGTAIVLLALIPATADRGMQFVQWVLAAFLLFVALFTLIFGLLRSEWLEMLVGLLSIVLVFSADPLIRIPVLIALLAAGLVKLTPILKREISRRGRELGHRRR